MFLNVAAQHTVDKTVPILADSVFSVLRVQDGKIVTIGKPISFKSLTAMDKGKIFFEAVYVKYPVSGAGYGQLQQYWLSGVF